MSRAKLMLIGLILLAGTALSDAAPELVPVGHEGAEIEFWFPVKIDGQDYGAGLSRLVAAYA